MKHKYGAHIGVGAGLVTVLDKAQQIGANCVQIFSSPPMAFHLSKFTAVDKIVFRQKAVEMDMVPNFIHAKYLINLGTEKSTLRKLSEDSLIADLHIAREIDARGVIVHTGSHKGKGLKYVLPALADSIRRILHETSESILYLEVASGGGGKIGSTFEELQMIINEVGNQRLGVCLDSAHLFAAGYGYGTREEVEVLSRKIETTIGWDSIGCMHVNDSKVPFGSGKDRHENLGAGEIGLEPLQRLMAHPRFGALPWILETPGFDNKGPDKQNVDILKSLVQ